MDEPPNKKRKHTKPPEKVAEGEGVERSGAEGDLDKSNEDPRPSPRRGDPSDQPDGEGEGVTFVECSLGLVKTPYAIGAKRR